MNVSRWLMTIAGVVALPVAAAAQTPGPDEPAPVPQVEPAGTGTPILDRVDSHWLASGFVGSSFAQEAEDPAFDFGGTVGYLWRGVLGGEFQANFSPEFELTPGRSALLLGNQPWINSYMINAIGAVPLGEDGRWQPYVSGGFGALTLRSDVLITDTGGNAFETDNARAAGNIGAGVLGFAQNVGFRADVRYFRGLEDDLSGADDLGELVGSQVLSQLDFWRATAGLAFRF